MTDMPEADFDWTGGFEARCPSCGVEHELVRPGKTQPRCLCHEHEATLAERDATILSLTARIQDLEKGKAELDLLNFGIAEVVKEIADDGGACRWHSCSGCYETEDGHAVGEYPFSALFDCSLGSGCHECGGIGVVWEAWSKADLAEMVADLKAPPPPVPDEGTAP